MADAPYESGELVMAEPDQGPPRLARVSRILPTDSSLPDAQWMVVCRWVEDDQPFGRPLHCNDEGVGRRLAPAGSRPAREAVARAS